MSDSDNDNIITDYTPTPFDNIEAPTEDPTTKEEAQAAPRAHYTALYASGFKEFLLKEELLKAVQDSGFEHPSEVQQECIPQALLGVDLICQAKAGMGKTAVFVLTTLNLLDPEKADKDAVSAVVLCHCRELAIQIKKEFTKFAKYLPELKKRIDMFIGGMLIDEDIARIKQNSPAIVVGTPGRMKALTTRNPRRGTVAMPLDKVKFFILDECDQMLGALDMRADVQAIFRETPHDKQVMMFSATMSKEIRPVCKKFMQDPMEIYVDDENKLVLHGLQQYYFKLEEREKNRKLNDLLDALEFNQVIIFVNKQKRAHLLNDLLVKCQFPSICITGGRLKQKERTKRLADFKSFKSRILVTTDLFGRGMDIERVNIVINYDFPDSADQYIHRVGRAGRFGTKGLTVSFIATEEDERLLNEVQARFEVDIPVLPAELAIETYMS